MELGECYLEPVGCAADSEFHGAVNTTVKGAGAALHMTIIQTRG